jgi:quercetin dioxygenase-like cupin family protein
VSGEPLAGAGEALRWRLHSLAAGERCSLRWERRDEGLLQIVAGAATATATATAGATSELDPATALWLRGEGEVELAAREPCRCLEVRVAGEPRPPLARSVSWSEVPREQIIAAMEGRSIAGDGVSAWLFEISAGYRVDDLEHAEEQISAPLRGGFEMLLDGEGTSLDPGAVAYVPAWRRHGGDFAASAVTLLEVFSPPRRGDLTQAL